MDNSQLIDFLSNLFNNNNLVTGPENPNKKNILVVVDNSLASEDLEILTKALSNKATVKLIYVSNVNKGMSILHNICKCVKIILRPKCPFINRQNV